MQGVWACPSLSENHHLYAGNEGATPSTSFTQTDAAPAAMCCNGVVHYTRRVEQAQTEAVEHRIREEYDDDTGVAAG